MIKIDIKPLSVNEAWKGRRYKTDKYKKYRRDLLLILPPHVGIVFTKDVKLEIDIEWGFSNKQADIDNPSKCFIDALQDKFFFNDSMIYKLNLSKAIVKKGAEYIKFEIKRLEIESPN